jgi:hypothetical protein
MKPGDLVHVYHHANIDALGIVLECINYHDAFPTSAYSRTGKNFPMAKVLIPFRGVQLFPIELINQVTK